MRNENFNREASTEKWLKPELSALVCWYYQCKHYTDIRIASVMHLDIEIVRSTLRRNCPEYEVAERQSKAGKKYSDVLRNNLGITYRRSTAW